MIVEVIVRGLQKASYLIQASGQEKEERPGANHQNCHKTSNKHLNHPKHRQTAVTDEEKLVKLA